MASVEDMKDDAKQEVTEKSEEIPKQDVKEATANNSSEQPTQKINESIETVGSIEETITSSTYQDSSVEDKIDDTKLEVTEKSLEEIIKKDVKEEKKKKKKKS